MAKESFARALKNLIWPVSSEFFVFEGSMLDDFIKITPAG
jgi:hypothetical protein